MTARLIFAVVLYGGSMVLLPLMERVHPCVGKRTRRLEWL